MLSVTRNVIVPVLVLLSVVGVGMQQGMIRNQNEMHSSTKSRTNANMQQTINTFRPLFPDKIFPPTILWQFCDFY